jgi:hypothetical protein
MRKQTLGLCLIGQTSSCASACALVQLRYIWRAVNDAQAWAFACVWCDELSFCICHAFRMFVFAYIARFRALLLARDIKFPAADDELVSYVVLLLPSIPFGQFSFHRVVGTKTLRFGFGNSPAFWP